MSSKPASLHFKRLPPQEWNCEFAHTFAGHSGWLAQIRSVDVARQGNLLATGSDDAKIKLWDLHTGNLSFELAGHQEAIRAVAINASHKLLASGSDDGKIKIWNLKTGQLVSTFSRHAKAVTTVAFSPNSDCLVSGSDDKTVRIWNLQTEVEIKKLHTHASYVQSVAFSQNGLLVASAGCDRIIKIRNLMDDETTLSITAHTDTISCVQFSPDNRFLISGGHDRKIKVWDVITGQELRCIHSEARINAISISSDGQVIASAEADETVKLYNLGSSELLTRLTGHSGGATSVAFDNSDQILAVGDASNKVKVWYVENRKPEIQKTQEQERRDIIWGVAFFLSLIVLPVLAVWLLGWLKGLLGWILVAFLVLVTAPQSPKIKQPIFHEKVPEFNS